MLRRLSRKAIETLEFRGILVLLAVVAGVIFYVSLFAGHRPKAEYEQIPTVPPGEAPPPSRI